MQATANTTPAPGSVASGPASAEDAAPATPDSTVVAPGSMTAGKLAELLGGELLGSAEVPISGIGAIDHARPGDLTFIRSMKYAQMWDRSKASVAILVREISPPRSVAEGRAIIVVADADVAQLKILSALAPAPTPASPGIDPSAKVDPSALIDPSAHIGPMCVVGPRAKVGARTDLVSGVHVGEEATVGQDTVIGPGSAIMDRCVIGNHCRVAGCVVIGADGFGYTLQSHPSGRGKYLVHFPHIGNVVIGDHVDIGANTCIDRAKFGSTSIGSGTKIDNLVQIGHNCRIGRSCVICGQVGLSGSVTLGDGVQLAGRVGVADNIHIGAMARVGASAGVMSDIPGGQSWLGAPAMPAKEAVRNMALFRRLSQVLKKVKLDGP
ncbi:MAG: UDP-3-O-(3-hydroxymyristoyl)glucosamine N-acyltransferase [Phycisphaeraceae bacterium]|nr:UDP-3-O-(3-hydroxymyristoyl)glucosamine N-acyltransferase [Phycisphaeraceae bacterium]